jgi:hypothetical protein
MHMQDDDDARAANPLLMRASSRLELQSVQWSSSLPEDWREEGGGSEAAKPPPPPPVRLLGLGGDGEQRQVEEGRKSGEWGGGRAEARTDPQ